MIIKKYKFGQININDKIYTSDIIILPDGKIISWWRKSGHHLVNEDLKEVYKTKPEILIIGTGAYGFMKVSKEVYEYCKQNNIKLIVDKTNKSVEIYNNEKNPNKASGFHLTC